MGPAWLLGSGFQLPLGLKKNQWQRLFEIARPGVQLRKADYELSEKATQNHTEQDGQYSVGRFRSLDSAPVDQGPIVGLRRHPGQNGGRSGVEYSGLEIGRNYIDQWIPGVCEAWGLAEIYDRDSRSTPAYVLGKVTNRIIATYSGTLGNTAVQGSIGWSSAVIDRKTAVSIEVILDIMDKLLVMFIYRTQNRSAYDSIYGHILSPKWDPLHHPDEQPSRIRRGLCAMLNIRIKMLELIVQLIKDGVQQFTVSTIEPAVCVQLTLTELLRSVETDSQQVIRNWRQWILFFKRIKSLFSCMENFWKWKERKKNRFSYFGRQFKLPWLLTSNPWSGDWDLR